MYWHQNLNLNGGVNGGFQFKRSFGATNVQLAASGSPLAVQTIGTIFSNRHGGSQQELCAQPAAQPSQRLSATEQGLDQYVSYNSQGARNYENN